MLPPSTDWNEQIQPDEEQRFARYAEQFVDFQRRKSLRYGTGRALHRKQVMALRARFDVLPDLPPHARAGLFARPGAHDALIRLSHASMNVQPDRVPDIHGFAIKVLGVDGRGALGDRTSEQNFVMINLPSFRLPTSEPFAGAVVAAAKGNAAVLAFLFRRYGPLRFAGQARRGLASLKHPFSGYATEPFHTAAPLACGEYAVRACLQPAAPRPAGASLGSDWAGDLRARLARGPLVHDFQLQFYVNEAITPIENAEAEWPGSEAPYVTVARLTVPQQETEGAAVGQLLAEVEAASFDPWRALDGHRPLGEVMRARRVVYYASQKQRGSA